MSSVPAGASICAPSGGTKSLSLNSGGGCRALWKLEGTNIVPPFSSVYSSTQRLHWTPSGRETSGNSSSPLQIREPGPLYGVSAREQTCASVGMGGPARAGLGLTAVPAAAATQAAVLRHRDPGGRRVGGADARADERLQDVQLHRVRVQPRKLGALLGKQKAGPAGASPVRLAPTSAIRVSENETPNFMYSFTD